MALDRSLFLRVAEPLGVGFAPGKAVDIASAEAALRAEGGPLKAPGRLLEVELDDARADACATAWIHVAKPFNAMEFRVGILVF